MAATCFSDYVEALARKQKLDPPAGYGYKAELELGVGFFREERTGVMVLEKPLLIPSGTADFQGYQVLYAYASKEGIESLLSGQLPPMLPATKKEPNQFASQAQIADNFGAKDGQNEAKKGICGCCVALRVPSELANPVDTPGRDLWIVRFDQDIVSPLLQAAKEGNADQVSKIIEAGASGAYLDEEGVTALMMAAMSGSVETCQVLIQKGAEVNRTEPNSNRSALMFASQGGHTPVVELLLSSRADPCQADSEGQTALHWAAVANRAATAKLLAGVRGVKDLVNQQGLTALAVAEKMGHSEAILVLK